MLLNAGLAQSLVSWERTELSPLCLYVARSGLAKRLQANGEINRDSLRGGPWLWRRYNSSRVSQEEAAAARAACDRGRACLVNGINRVSIVSTLEIFILNRFHFFSIDTYRSIDISDNTNLLY